MYWCKIAQTEKEFEAIARLNYETFVEEIPQHEPNHAKKRRSIAFIRKIHISLSIKELN